MAALRGCQVELLTQCGNVFRVEMTQERFRTLALKRDLDVLASPKEIGVLVKDAG